MTVLKQYANDIRLLTDFKDQSLELVKKNGLVLQEILYLDITVPFVLDNSKVITKNLEEICLAACQQNGLAMQFITTINLAYCRPPHILQILAKNNIPINIFEENTSLAAVRQNGLALQYVLNQTKNICIEAVKNNNKAFKYVYKQFRTQDLLLEAIENYPKAIKYVKQDIDICRRVLAIDPLVLKYVSIIDQELYLETVKKNGLALQYITFENQNKEIIENAFKQNKLSVKYMNPIFFEIYL